MIEREQQRHVPALQVPEFWTSQEHSTIRTQQGVQQFAPFAWQRRFIDEGLTHKELVLKSRDVGSSEICVRYFCWLQLKEGGNILIKADKHDNAKNLIAIARQYLTSLPEGERPTLTKDNETELALSGIGTIRAMARGGGRSERCRYLLCTERAFWEDSEEELAAISGALVAGGYEIIESTANGFNEFHTLWVEPNDYRKTFVGRAENPTHDAAWEAAKQTQLSATPKKFKQEYPAEPLESFLASGHAVFDLTAIEEHITDCRAPLETDQNGLLRIWQRPMVGRRYVLGADVAEGKDVGNDRLDYSGAAVYDWQTCAHVADLHGQWPVDQFAKLLAVLGHQYNDAFIAVERNNHGHAVLLMLQQLEYTNLYWHDDPQAGLKEQSNTPKRVLGWPTTSVTKPILEQTLGAAIKAHSLTSYDRSFWDECRSYVYQGTGGTGAQPGCHDDRVIKHAIALAVRPKMPHGQSPPLTVPFRWG